MPKHSDYNIKNERINPRVLYNKSSEAIANIVQYYKEDVILVIELLTEIVGDENKAVNLVAKKLGRSTTGIKKTYIRK